MTTSRRRRAAFSRSPLYDPKARLDLTCPKCILTKAVPVIELTIGSPSVDAGNHCSDLPRPKRYLGSSEEREVGKERLTV